MGLIEPPDGRFFQELMSFRQSLVQENEQKNKKKADLFDKIVDNMKASGFLVCRKDDGTVFGNNEERFGFYFFDRKNAEDCLNFAGNDWEIIKIASFIDWSSETQ